LQVCHSLRKKYVHERFKFVAIFLQIRTCPVSTV